MRNTFVISYDVGDPKRWRKVYRLMLGIGDPVQFSVFRCDLNRSEKVLFMEKLVPVLNQNEDRIMVVDLGPAGEERTGDDRIECWGKPLVEMPERKAKII
jgi:CRISPR-associated protein Cas2